MREEKKRRLEAKGWKIGSVREFLDLSEQEAAYVELKLHLAHSVKAQRRRRGMSQMALAKALRSSQSRVAKIEAGDTSVSMDLLIRSLLAMGTSARELSRIIASSSPSRAS